MKIGAIGDDLVRSYEELVAFCAGYMDGAVGAAPDRRTLLTTTRSAEHLVGERGQLALLGWRTGDQIDAESRTASLDDCRSLGEEHGAVDARECLEAATSLALEEVDTRQLLRAERRIRRLAEAGLSAAQLEAYTTAAAATFKSVIEQAGAR